MNSAPTAPVTPAMAITGSVFTVASSAIRAIKKPRTFSGGASVQMMRSLDYARTSPETRQGFPIFVVRFAVVVMARKHIGGPDRRQWRNRPQRG
jgi:hypothetical protein